MLNLGEDLLQHDLSCASAGKKAAKAKPRWVADNENYAPNSQQHLQRRKVKRRPAAPAPTVPRVVSCDASISKRQSPCHTRVADVLSRAKANSADASPPLVEHTERHERFTKRRSEAQVRGASSLGSSFSHQEQDLAHSISALSIAAGR